MAVWMNVFGKNGLGRYDQEKVADYLAILNGVDLDAVKILTSLEEAGITRSEARSRPVPDREEMLAYFTNMPAEEYSNYLASVGKQGMSPEAIADWLVESMKRIRADWLTGLNNSWDAALKGVKPSWQLSSCDQVSASFFNCLQLTDKWEGLRVSLSTDLVCMSGPWAMFSKMSHFPSMSRESGAYYHSLFKNILQAFKSNFLLYAHEWSGLYLDDEINILTSDELLADVSKSKHVPPESMYDLDSWFIERW